MSIAVRAPAQGSSGGALGGSAAGWCIDGALIDGRADDY